MASWSARALSSVYFGGDIDAVDKSLHGRRQLMQPY